MKTRKFSKREKYMIGILILLLLLIIFSGERVGKGIRRGCASFFHITDTVKS